MSTCAIAATAWSASPTWQRASASGTSASLSDVPVDRCRSILLGQRQRLLTHPQVHGHARRLQRHAELAEALAERDRLLDASPGVGLLAEARRARFSGASACISP